MGGQQWVLFLRLLPLLLLPHLAITPARPLAPVPVLTGLIALHVVIAAPLLPPPAAIYTQIIIAPTTLPRHPTAGLLAQLADGGAGIVEAVAGPIEEAGVGGGPEWGLAGLLTLEGGGGQPAGVLGDET